MVACRPCLARSASDQLAFTTTPAGKCFTGERAQRDEPQKPSVALAANLRTQRIQSAVKR